MSTPFFSCVLPVKGTRPYLIQAIQSIERQHFHGELEIIVQDGDLEADLGQSDALNHGLAKTHGDWLFWLNADDILLPGALKRVQQHVDISQSASWIAGNQLLIDSNSKVLKCSVGNKWHPWLYCHAVPHVYGPSAFFRRELFEKVGGFDISLKYCMDWDLWIKFMKAGAKFERIPEYLWAQRQWEGSKTQRRLSNEEKKEHLAEVHRMADKNDVVLTQAGVWLTRLERLREGCYLKEWLDGRRVIGKYVHDFCL